MYCLDISGQMCGVLQVTGYLTLLSCGVKKRLSFSPYVSLNWK